MKIEILPRAKDDIIRQFEYYVVEHDAPRVAIRFREAVKETLNRLNVRPRIGAQLRCSIPGGSLLAGYGIAGYSHLLSASWGFDPGCEGLARQTGCSADLDGGVTIPKAGLIT